MRNRKPTKGVSGEILLYRTSDGGTTLDVRLDRETVWLSQRQMAELFDKDTDTIGLHIRNIYKERELKRSSTTEKSSVVQQEGKRTVHRMVAVYNLDVIISVGYRVKSKRGTQFRIWATKVLRDHILKGYTVNQRRLDELNHAVRLIADVAGRRELTGDEATAILRVVSDYSYALDLLDDYDHNRVEIAASTPVETVPVRYEEAQRIVEHLRIQIGGTSLFGREKDTSLQSSLAAVMQTANGEDVYPTV